MRLLPLLDPPAVRDFVAFEEHTEDEMVPPPLRPGDVVEMTVEGIGTIRNRVVPGLDLPPVRPARPRSRRRAR